MEKQPYLKQAICPKSYFNRITILEENSTVRFETIICLHQKALNTHKKTNNVYANPRRIKSLPIFTNLYQSVP